MVHKIQHKKTKDWATLVSLKTGWSRVPRKGEQFCSVSDIRGNKQNHLWFHILLFSSTVIDLYISFSIPPVDITFGHGDTILPLYAAFGLFKDDHAFTADNFVVNKNRQFRTSKIVSFSANIAIALYKCGGNGNHVVKMFVNEEQIIIPGCDGTVCSYNTFKNKYPQLVNCNFDQICDNATSKCSHLTAYALLIWIIALVIQYVNK